MRFAETLTNGRCRPERRSAAAFGAPVWLWRDPDRREQGKHAIRTADEARAALRWPALVHRRQRFDGQLARDWLAAFSALAHAEFHRTPEKIEDARRMFRELADGCGALVEVHAVSDGEPQAAGEDIASLGRARNTSPLLGEPSIPSRRLSSALFMTRTTQGKAMTNRYRVRVNGEEFWAAADEVLLDAALRNGVDIPHDCRSGQCGKCRVRPIGGKLLFRGDVLAEGHGEEIEACQSRVVSNVALAVDALPESLSTSGEVVEVRDVSPGMVEVLVSPSSALTIAPGQYLNVAFDGFPARAFSPTVCLEDPSRPGALHFHIRRIPGGCVSAALGREIVSGHAVKLVGPFGSAHLQPGLASRLVLVAEDAGFAPIWSIAAVALQEHPGRPIVLVVGCRTDDFYMQPALRWLAAYPNVSMTLLGAEAFQDASSPAAFLSDHVPDLSPEDVVHVAGPEATIHEVMSRAQAAGAACFADKFAASGHPAGEPRSDYVFRAWRLRRSRRSARQGSDQGLRAAGLDRTGIRSRRGVDFYLRGVAAIGALLACSGLLAGALTPAGPSSTAGTSTVNGEQAFTQTASASDSLLLQERVFSPEQPDVPPVATQAALQLEQDRQWALRGPGGHQGAGNSISPADDPAQGAEPANAAPVAGVWAPDASACSARQNRKRLIPAVITADGASAGDTFCTFKNKRATDAGLDVVASCSNPQGQWTTKVRLTVSGNRLTWSSKRGTQAYLRCEPNTRLAEAR